MVDRRGLMAGMVGLALGATRSARAEGDAKAPIPGAVRLRWNEPIEVRARASRVGEGKPEIHVVSIGRARFKLDEAGHLTAELNAAVYQTARLDYWISAAVFDSAGRMLGAATHKEEVHRLVLGRVVMAIREIPMDFGISTEYGRAEYAVVSIGERELPNLQKDTPK